MQPEQGIARLALVVGNANYRSAPRLRNAIHDARAIAEKLALLGFRVRTEFDLDGEHFQRVVGEFVKDLAATGGLEKRAQALIFFAGHGVQVRGENYLLPVDGDIASEVDLRLRTVHLNIVTEAMGSAAETSIIILDCCRDNPLPRTLTDKRTRSIASQGGLASFDAPSGAFVAFATQPDNVAEDGDGDHSPFTAALAHLMDRPDTPISELMIHVRRVVHARTNGRQIPWDRSALFQPFAFKSTGGALRGEALTPEQQEEAREGEYWNLIAKSDSIELLRSFVIQFPYGLHKNEAVARIEELRRRQFMRGIWTKVAAIAFGIVALTGLWYGQKWARFTTLNGELINSDLVGGDLYFDAMHSKRTKGEPQWLCRLKCTTSLECQAYSYDVTEGICYRKFQYGYFERTKDVKWVSSSNSEVLRWPSMPPPKEMKYKMHWDRQLIGDLLPRDKVEADPAFKDKYFVLKRNNKQYWEASSIDCQRRCHELEKDCDGFTYSTFYRHCQLFAMVRGIALDPANNAELSFPATQSGCRSRRDDCRTPPPVAVAPAPPAAATAAPIVTTPPPAAAQPPAAAPAAPSPQPAEKPAGTSG